MKLRAWLCSATVTFCTGLVAAGCGGGGSSKPLIVDDFCTQKAQKECQVTVRCATDKTTCETQRRALCMTFAQATMSPTRPFRPENVAACISETNRVYAKTSPITPTDLASMDDACNYVFQGSVARDGTCATKYDCTGKVICDRAMRCETQVNKNNGDDCSGAGAVCTQGLYCTGTPVPRCMAKKVLTNVCDDMNPCIETLRCMGGICAARAMANDPCATDDDCPTTAPYCDPNVGNHCDSGLSFAGGAPSCAAFGGSGGLPDSGTGQDASGG
jgi:hypothetical protein